MKITSLNRRQFLKLTGVAAGGALSGFAPHLASINAQNILDIRAAKGEHPAQPLVEDAPSRIALTEKTGVHMSLLKTPSADYSAKQQVWLATDQVPDIMEVDNALTIQTYAREGVLLPLNDLIEQHAPNIKRYLEDNPEMRKLTIDDQFYYLPGFRYNWLRNASMPMIRLDLLDELGIPAPTNFDELFTTLQAFKAAKPDAAIWANRSGTSRLLSQIAYPMGSGYEMYFDKDIEGGKWLFGGIHEEFKFVLDFFSRAYAEGLLDPDYSITTSDQWHQKNSSDSGLFCWENMQFGLRWNLALRETTPEATWGPLATLNGPMGARQFDYGTLIRGFAIGANAAQPERIVQMMDWMISPEGLEVTNWGINGVHYTTDYELPEAFEDYTSATIEKYLDPSKRHMVQEVFDEFAAKSDPFRSYQSATGTGLLDFAILVDSAINNRWDAPGEQEQWFDLTANDPGLSSPILVPPFNPEEGERLADILIDVQTILEPAYERVILGQMPLSDYDASIEQAINAGAAELEDIYNAAQARL